MFKLLGFISAIFLVLFGIVTTLGFIALTRVHLIDGNLIMAVKAMGATFISIMILVGGLKLLIWLED